MTPLVETLLETDKLSVSDLPENARGSVFQNPTTRRLVLQLLASGVSYESVADRIQIPVAKLVKLMETPGLNAEFQQLLRESQTTDNAENLLRGSLVDSVLCLIRLRNADTTSDRLKAQISQYLIQQNLGMNKTGLGAKPEDHFLQAQREGKSRLEALDEDLQRLIQSDPMASALLERTKRSGTPESGRRPTEGLSSGDPVACATMPTLGGRCVTPVPATRERVD